MSNIRSGAFGHALQRGLLAIDALLFSSFILVMIAIGAWVLGEISRSNQARAAGNYLVQYATAVQLALSNERSALVGTYTDADWLKDSTQCAAAGGTANEPYMPNCGFPDTDPGFGYSVTTTVTHDVPSDVTTAVIAYDAEAIEGQLALINQIVRRAQMGDTSSSAALTYAVVSVAAIDDGDADALEDTVQVTVDNTSIGDFIRADGTREWNNEVTQDVNQSNFTDVGSITGDPTATGGAVIEMSSFLDADDNSFGLDPDQTSTLNGLSVATITNDPLITVAGVNKKLSQVIMHDKGVVASGDSITKPTTCTAAGSVPELQGWVVGIVANDGSYSDPKNLKGFNVYATDNGLSWTVKAKAFVDDEDKNYEIDPAGLALIGYMTSCS